MVWGSRLLYFKALFLSSVFSEWKLVFTLPTPPPPSHTLISRKILYIKKIFLGKWRKGIGSWAANFQMVLESSDFCLAVWLLERLHPQPPPYTLILELVQLRDTKDSLQPHSQWRSSPAHCLMISPDVCPACRMRQSQQRWDEKQAHLRSSHVVSLFG